MNFELNEDNFLLYAIKHYDNPNCSGMHEFSDDLKRIKYIKRLLKKYICGNDLKERLVLNHLIVLNNLFGPEATTKMLFYKLEEPFWPQLKTFLVFLNCIKDDDFISHDIRENEIPLDYNIVKKLRDI